VTQEFTVAPKGKKDEWERKNDHETTLSVDARKRGITEKGRGEVTKPILRGSSKDFKG